MLYKWIYKETVTMIRDCSKAASFYFSLIQGITLFSASPSLLKI